MDLQLECLSTPLEKKQNELQDSDDVELANV